MILEDKLIHKKHIELTIKNAKIFLLSFLCIMLSFQVHYISHFFLFPLFSITLVYFFVEQQKNVSPIVIGLIGIMHDFILSPPFNVYIFFLTGIFFGVNHFQRFILQNSSLKDWMFFSGLCLVCFLIENLTIFFVFFEQDMFAMFERSAIHYILLAISYPTLKKIFKKIYGKQ